MQIVSISRRGLFARFAAGAWLFCSADANGRGGGALPVCECPAEREGRVTYCYDELGRIVSETWHFDPPST